MWSIYDRTEMSAEALAQSMRLLRVVEYVSHGSTKAYSDIRPFALPCGLHERHPYSPPRTEKLVPGDSGKEICKDDARRGLNAYEKEHDKEVQRKRQLRGLYCEIGIQVR